MKESLSYINKTFICNFTKDFCNYTFLVKAGRKIIHAAKTELLILHYDHKKERLHESL